MTEPTGTPGPQEPEGGAPDAVEEELAPVHFPSVRGSRDAARAEDLSGATPDAATRGIPGPATETPDAAAPAWSDELGTDAAPDARAGASDDDLSATDAGAAATEGTDGRGWFARLPWWAWVAAGVVVIAVVVAIVVGTRSGGPSGAATAPTVTTTLPAPTPTATPVDHSDGSDLFTSLPGTTAQFVLTAVADAPAWVDDSDAVESYTLTYQGPSTASVSSASPVTVSYTAVVGQWAKAEDATAFAASLVSAQPADPTATTTNGDVTAAGTKVGTSTITVPADAAADGTAVWTNGTVVVQVTGPGADLQRFFDGFGW